MVNEKNGKVFCYSDGLQHPFCKAEFSSRKWLNWMSAGNCDKLFLMSNEKI